MINEIFSIDKFNIISDNDNYYFFRALNNSDNTDIETREILDKNNNIISTRHLRVLIILYQFFHKYQGLCRYS